MMKNCINFVQKKADQEETGPALPTEKNCFSHAGRNKEDVEMNQGKFVTN